MRGIFHKTTWVLPLLLIHGSQVLRLRTNPSKSFLSLWLTAPQYWVPPSRKGYKLSRMIQTQGTGRSRCFWIHRVVQKVVQTAETTTKYLLRWSSHKVCVKTFATLIRHGTTNRRIRQMPCFARCCAVCRQNLWVFLLLRHITIAASIFKVFFPATAAHSWGLKEIFSHIS